MKHIKQRMENVYATKLTIENHQDPSDGSVSMSAVVTNGYTGEELLRLDWYYDFGQLMHDLDKQIAAKLDFEKFTYSGYYSSEI